MSNSNVPHSPGIIRKDSRSLSTLSEWYRHAPPKGGAGHWRDGRSAKECARAWIDAAPDLPSGISDVLHSCNDIGPLHDWCAEPEARVQFDNFGRGPANIDVLLTGYDQHGPVVVAIEAKADEPFGETVETTLSKARTRLKDKPRSKGVERIQQLAGLFRLTLKQPDVLELRYQLMTITAAALAKAEKRKTRRAIVMIHEFVTCCTNDKKQARNSRDLDCFLETVFSWRTPLQCGKLAGPFTISHKPILYFGKVKTIVKTQT